MKRITTILAALLLMACSAMPVHAEEERQYSIQNITAAEEPFPECGIMYKEVCTMQITSFSVSENGMVAVAGSHYVNVYDPDGKFVCAFYSYTSKSHLEVVIHDDWIEIYNTSGSYTVYTLDGTILLCGYAKDVKDFGFPEWQTLEIGDAQYDVNTMNRKLTKTTAEGSSHIYEMTAETYTLVSPEPAGTDVNEPHITFQTASLPTGKNFEPLEVRIDGNDFYAPLSYSVNSAGEVLLCTGDYLHIYNPEGYYERSLYLRGLSPVSFAFYTDCIQLYYDREHALVTYDRNGNILSAVSLPDTPENSDAIRALQERCYTDSEEVNGSKFRMGRDYLSKAIPDNKIVMLYIRQDYSTFNTLDALILRTVISAIALVFFIVFLIKVKKGDM